jgi:hypothetical protein
VLRSLLGEVGGYGLGLRSDSDGAMVAANVGVFMPNGKKGLTELADRPSARGNPPGFVPVGALSYSSFNFDFSGLMAVIKNVVSSNPMLNMQMGEAMPEVEKNVAPILAALGSKVHSAGPVAGATDQAGVLAIECRDTQAFENAFGAAAGQGGLEARDFLGQRIYTMDEQMSQMMPMAGGLGGTMSIGIGGGNVFVGATAGVEQALRSTGQTDVAGLAKDEAFQRATGVLGDDQVVAWGYMDTIGSMEAAIKAQQAGQKKMIEDMKEFDPEMAAEMEKELAAAGDPMKDFDPAFVRQYIGPSVWKATSNDKGFVFNMHILPAAKN